MTIAYDPMLVMLAIFVAITGAVTGLTLTVGFDQRYGQNPLLSLLKGAMVTGLTVWTTHLVAIVAVILPDYAGYSFIETMVSLYVAIIGAALGLFIARSRYFGALNCALGGIILGAASAAAHYIAMSAIRGYGIEQREEGIVVTVTIAVISSMVALWFGFRRRGIAATLTGGALLGAGVAGTHLNALSATTFTTEHQAQLLAAPLLTGEALSYLVVAATVIVCGLFFYLFARLTLEQAEERALPVYRAASELTSDKSY